jgi:TusA-related sulfurtransferase
MAEVLDFRGLKCPQPVLKLAIKANSLPKGTTVEVLADCHTFPVDVTNWCSKSGKVLVSIVPKDGANCATIQL